MKRVFAVLLLANAGLAMWGLWYRAPSDEQRHARPPINAQHMRLLSEPGVTPAPRSTAPLSPLQPGMARPFCFSVGPFADETKMQETLALLRGPIWQGHARDEAQRVPGVYRVYLPPAPTLAAAEAKRKDLTHLGIREHYLIQEHDKKNAISLGVFSTDEAAHRLAAKLAGKGIRAQVETLYRTQHQYWVDASAPNPDALAQFHWPTGLVSQRSCDSVAILPTSTHGTQQ